MMKLFTILILIVVSTTLFSQEYMPKHNPNFIENQLLTESNQDLKLVNNHRENIWIKDSTLAYKSEFNEWHLTNREKVLMRNDYGNMTHSISQDYDVNTFLWTYKDTINATYYNGKSLHTYIRKPWNNNTQEWADTSQYLGYNENGNILVNLVRGWSKIENIFIYGYKYIYSYNDDGYLDYTTSYYWNLAIQNWVLAKKRIDTYDSNDLKMQMIIQNWDSDIELWTNHSKDQYGYDDEGNWIESYQQRWNISTQEWENSSLKTVSYDDDGNRVEFVQQSWDSDTEKWINYWQELMVYNDDGNQTEFTDQSWDLELDEWINSNQGFFTYDDANNWLHYFSRIWDIETEEWINSGQELRIYDDAGNRTQNTSQRWNNNTAKWEDNSKKEYYWSEFEISGVAHINENNIRIFPNPVKDILKIYGINNAIISIYTYNGKLIKHTKLYNGEIDLSSLSSGNYLLKVEYEGNIITKPFIKE